MDVKEKIRNSRVFLVIGTKNFFNDPDCLAQAEYAKSLGKPFRVLLEMGETIPDGFLVGVEDCKIIPADFTDPNFYNEELLLKLQ